MYFEQPKSSNGPELNYNTTYYSIDVEDAENGLRVPHAIKTDLNIQLYCAVSKLPYHPVMFPCSVMVTSAGKILPAHHPLITDHPNMHLGFWAYLDWCSNRLAAQGSWLLYPNNLLAVVDPRPAVVVDDLPVYNFPDSRSHVFIASNAHAIHVMSVEHTFTGVEITVVPRYFQTKPRAYTEVCLEGKTMVGTEVSAFIPRGTVVVAWNALSMTRPSFRATFFEMFERHHPSLMVVTEARISNNDCRELISNLPGEYQSKWFENQCGGVVLMWRGNDLLPNYNESDLGSANLLFTVLFEVLHLISYFGSQRFVLHRLVLPLGYQTGMLTALG